MPFHSIVPSPSTALAKTEHTQESILKIKSPEIEVIKKKLSIQTWKHL